MPDERTRMLVVEDDRNIVDLIQANLAVRGYAVVTCGDAAKALWTFEQEEPDLVLLDLNLPNGDGFDLCRQLRERSPAGIIVVSARRGEHDKVRALNLGADDYLTKPFGIEELLARIGATLRRSRPAAPVATPPLPPVRAGDVEIDLDRRQVLRRGEPVHLTPTEFSVLAELARQPGTLLTHGHLLRKVWGVGYETETEYVRVYVKRLRAKLEGAGAPPVILTEPRVGYRLAPPGPAPG
ncbi:MAG TPA: response regulator transcription factor [Acidimicrobiia bacterium]|nr:response regulator transcription factor [Acidimicrobiia bacterium]